MPMSKARKAELAKRNVEYSLRWLEGAMRRYAGPDGDINLLDVLAATRGWLPLKVREVMTVHYGSREYVIKRTV
jgi:hypothetical protein